MIIRSLGLQEYEPLWRRMQRFTNDRSASTPDETWFTEHPSVFTLGMNASRDHLIAPGNTPVVQVDRGGQVTYHGPGQLMIYPLLDLKRAKLGVRDLVTALERCVINFVAESDIAAIARKDAPGVYVANRKIASVGLRIRRGASYHGMALNIDMDLEPFSRINPCGFSDLEVTDLKSLGITADRDAIQAGVQKHLLEYLEMDADEIVNAD
jgi:lipoyl(octanoyl) transferase